MNPYIAAQLMNMRAAVINCRESCHWAARKDDAITDREEYTALRKIDKAVDKFLRELDKIK